jgi:hypothetical protein
MLYYYLTGNALQRTQGWAKTCFGGLLLQVFQYCCWGTLHAVREPRVISKLKMTPYMS